MKTSFVIALVLFCLLFAQGFSATTTENKPNSFRQYWYQGKAELTRYALDQARYGEIHKGDAVLIFVTEPFLKDKEVKLEHGDGSNALSVLKLNFVRKFYTGIYQYSILTSVFSPVDYQHQKTLKVSSTTQEWCGHTYTQLNFKNNQFETESHSYFQDEADKSFQLNPAWLEDEIWTRIRIAPGTLPAGNIEMIPALQFSRLWHTELKVEQAQASLSEKNNRNVYVVQYKSVPRRLEIQFDKNFPYAILEWSETYPGGFGKDTRMLTTRGVRTNSILLDYWNKHSVADAPYRRQLGLTS